VEEVLRTRKWASSCARHLDLSTHMPTGRCTTGCCTVTGAVIAIAVALSSATDVALTLWALAQLVNCLWPWNSPFAAQAEAWAWAQFDAERSGIHSAPEPVPELLNFETLSGPVSLSRPWVIRGLLNGSSTRMLKDYAWLLDAPVGDVEVDYFTNASAVDGIIPDARASLREVVGGIIAGGSAKIGTEMIMRRFPWLLDELQISERVGPLLGGADVVASSRVGLLLTVPVFMATGAPNARTDLHCEPIGNLMLQLGGRKTWTLVPPEESRHLRPTISKDGRAYLYSRLPTEDPERTLAHVRRWVVESRAGDAVWVPTWTWHRVDYLDGVTALSASLFHPRHEQIVSHNPLYALIVAPNMLKELLGLNAQ